MASKCPNFKLNNGLTIPAVGLGTWRAPAGQVENAVDFALANGYRHIDCAHCYGNEKEVGTGLARAFKGNLKREDVFVTSKLWNTHHNPDDVLPACKHTLTNLGLNYLDLYLMHWPCGLKLDKENPDAIIPKDEKGYPVFDETPIEKTWAAMENLVDLGYVKSIGLSNFNKSQIERIVKVAKHKPTVLQIESHPYFNQSDLVECCKKHDILVTAYSPLGSAPKEGKPHPLKDADLKAVADKFNKTPAHVCIRYQVDRGVAVIPKSVKTHRISANFDVFDFKLADTDLAAVSKLDRDYRTCVPRVTLPSGEVILRDAGHAEQPFLRKEKL